MECTLRFFMWWLSAPHGGVECCQRRASWPRSLWQQLAQLRHRRSSGSHPGQPSGRMVGHGCMLMHSPSYTCPMAHLQCGLRSATVRHGPPPGPHLYAREASPHAAVEEDSADDSGISDDDSDSSASEAKPKRTEIVPQWDLLNGQKAIWLRPAKDVEPEEYNSFYAALSKVWPRQG